MGIFLWVILFVFQALSAEDKLIFVKVSIVYDEKSSNNSNNKVVYHRIVERCGKLKGCESNIVAGISASSLRYEKGKYYADPGLRLNWTGDENLTEKPIFKAVCDRSCKNIQRKRAAMSSNVKTRMPYKPVKVKDRPKNVRPIVHPNDKPNKPGNKNTKKEAKIAKIKRFKNPGGQKTVRTFTPTNFYEPLGQLKKPIMLTSDEDELIKECTNTKKCLGFLDRKCGTDTLCYTKALQEYEKAGVKKGLMALQTETLARNILRQYAKKNQKLTKKMIEIFKDDQKRKQYLGEVKCPPSKVKRPTFDLPATSQAYIKEVIKEIGYGKTLPFSKELFAIPRMRFSADIFLKKRSSKLYKMRTGENKVKKVVCNARPLGFSESYECRVCKPVGGRPVIFERGYREVTNINVFPNKEHRPKIGIKSLLAGSDPWKSYPTLPDVVFQLEGNNNIAVNCKPIEEALENHLGTNNAFVKLLNGLATVDMSMSCELIEPAIDVAPKQTENFNVEATKEIQIIPTKKVGVN